MVKSPRVLHECDYGQQQRGKKVLLDSHCAEESVDNKQQAGTETQDRVKSKAGERETELKRKG